MRQEVKQKPINEFIGNWHDVKSRIGNSVPPNLMKAIAEHIKVEVLSRVNG